MRITLPKTNKPLKIGHHKRKLVFQPSIFRDFRCYVSFREGGYPNLLQIQIAPFPNLPIFGTSALSLPPLLSISSNLQNGGTYMWNGVGINCTTVGVAVKINIIRNKDVYLNYMCNFMFGLSHCPAPESRNVRLVFAIANDASHIQFYHLLTDSPAWMNP